MIDLLLANDGDIVLLQASEAERPMQVNKGKVYQS